MGHMVSATEARIHFGELMRRAVERREPIFVEQGGKPRGVVLSVGEYERLVGGEPPVDWKAQVGQARSSIQADLAGREMPAPEEVLRQMRGERDERRIDAARVGGGISAAHPASQ